MINKEAAYKTIEELVLRFEEQSLSYKKSDYNEAQTLKGFYNIKKYFLDFFKPLCSHNLFRY